MSPSIVSKLLCLPGQRRLRAPQFEHEGRARARHDRRARELRDGEQGVVLRRSDVAREERGDVSPFADRSVALAE